jgi:PAS domain S-box-containing protein
MVSSPGADSGSVPEARFYRLAMESLPDTVFVASGDGSIDWVCANVAPVFGPNPTSVAESETVGSLLSPAFVDPLEPGERRLENRPITVTDADGVAHHYLVTVTRLADERASVAADADAEDTDAALVYACRDVTDVERLKGELDEVFERVTDGFVALDTSFVVTYANDHAVELFGRPREELLGRKLWSFASDPESTRAFELLPKALETGEPLSYEAYFEPQDRWYEARVFPSETGVSVYFSDVTERVERQSALEASERRFRRLVEELPDPLVVIDDDTVVHEVNPALCELMGVAEGSLVGRRMTEFTHGAFDDDESDRGRARLVRDDDTRLVEYVGVRDVWPGEHVFLLRDITAREEYRAELEEVYERITDGVFSLDVDFEIEYANEQFARSIGREPADLVGECLWDVVPDAEELELFELLPEVLASGEPTTYEGYYEPADVWYEVSIYPSETGLSVYSRDVTERVTQARALAESEARFRALFEGSLDALVLADDDGRYVDVNSAACELYGLPHAELLGKTAADFAAPGFDFDAAWDAFLDAGSMRGEFELVRPDGDTRVTDFAARANIRPGEHLSVLRDVTERVERERQLEVQRDELAHLNRINRLAREVNRAIVGADTPDEVLSNVCRRLVDADVYRHAVVASGTAGGRFEVAAASGLSTTAAEAVVDALGQELTTARRRVTSVIGPSPPEVRSSVDADVFGCFPLAYGGTVHGVLVIGAERSAETPVLVGEEGALLDDLGTTVGKAITAVTARRLLHADEVVSLEFAVDDADDVFNELSRELGAKVTVTALVPMADGRHACYVTVEGSDSAGGWDEERLSETIGSSAVVDDCRVVSAEGPVRLEIHVDGGSPALALENQGTHVRTVASTNGRGTLVVEIPTESNVRNLVAGLVADYPDTRLVRKLTERRPGDGTGYIGGRPVPVSDERGNALTEKQLAALRAAHAGGYYDWPRRGSSAQELADALGVASATYHQHLRAAEGKLVDAFFGR